MKTKLRIFLNLDNHLAFWSLISGHWTWHIKIDLILQNTSSSSFLKSKIFFKSMKAKDFFPKDELKIILSDHFHKKSIFYEREVDNLKTEITHYIFIICISTVLNTYVCIFWKPLPNYAVVGTLWLTTWGGTFIKEPHRSHSVVQKLF